MRSPASRLDRVPAIAEALPVPDGLRRRVRRAQRLLLNRDRVVGSIASARDYVEGELGAPGRFVSVVESESFPGRPGRTVGEQDELLSSTWNHVDWEGWRVSLPAGRVVGRQSLVLSADGRALRESAFDDSHLDANPVFDAGLPRPRRVPGRLLVLTGPWAANWYHWLLDLLPRAALLPIAEDPDAEILVPAGLSPAQEESLTLAGVPTERRRPFTGGQIAADELVFPSFIGPTGNPPRWGLRWLRERLAPPPRTRGRRLYVSRADASQRRIVNDSELTALLRERGFETLLPGDLSLSDQLGAFAGAAVVLGPHGAGLANLLAATDASVIELHRGDDVRPCYFAQANAQGLDYTYLLCEPVGGREDLRVDLHQLERTLDAAGIA
jgi:capsular polysaccharide biosynthesis protein